MNKTISMLLSVALCASIAAGCSKSGARLEENPAARPTHEQGQDPSQGQNQEQPPTQQAGGNYANMSVTPASQVQGFSIRAPQTDEERFAMQFVDALFWRDHSSIIDMTDIASLAPAAPYGEQPEDIFQVIVRRCIGYMNFQVNRDYSEYDFSRSMCNGLNVTWSDRETPEACSIGIVDVTDVGIVVAHSWDGTREGFYAAGKRRGTPIEVNGAATVRVAVDRVADGSLKAVAAQYKPGLHGQLIDQEFQFTVPRGGIVTFRGEVLAPVSGGDDEPGKYLIKDMHYRVPEEISVDFGEVFGVIRDILIVDNLGSSVDDGPLVLLSNDVANGLFTHLPSLAITMPEYKGIANDVSTSVERFVKQIVNFLETDNFEGFDGILVEGGEAERNTRNMRREFDNWVAAEVDLPFTGIKRTILIGEMNILTPRSINVRFHNTLVAPSGTPFFSRSSFALSNIDGQWKIWSMSHELFSRSTANWWEITEEIADQLRGGLSLISP